MISTRMVQESPGLNSQRISQGSCWVSAEKCLKIPQKPLRSENVYFYRLARVLRLFCEFGPRGPKDSCKPLLFGVIKFRGAAFNSMERKSEEASAAASPALSVLKRCVPKTLAFVFGLRLRSKTRCFKTRVLGSLVAVSKSVFQRKIPRLNPEVYRLSSHPTSAQLPLLDFPPLLSLKPLPTSRVTQRRSSRGFVPTPNPSLAQEPFNLQRILSETHSFPNICGPKTQRFRVLSRNARFSVKRSVLAQDASQRTWPY